MPNFASKNRKMWLKSVVVGGRRTNVRISGGEIAEVGTAEPTSGPVRDFSGRTVYAAPGFVGFGVGMTAPGNEHRDSPEDLAASAVAGGFTDVVLVADGNTPFPDHADALVAAKRRYSCAEVDFHFTGAATVGGKGAEMAELYDMLLAGATAFFDGYRPGLSAPILARVMEYLGGFGALAVQTPLDAALAADGLVNESPFTVRLGLKRIPPVAELVFVKTALELVEYTDGRLHFTALTQADAQSAVIAAARRGLDVSYDLTPHHFRLTDEVLAGFDSNHKIFPPLRSSDNQAALQAAFWNDGDTGFFSVQHLPRTLEEKEMEFAAADFGVLGLETAAAATFDSARHAEWERRWSALPRRRLGLPPVEIRPGFPAKITLYEIASNIVGRGGLRSRCANSPFLGMMLPLRVLGTVNG